MKQSRPADRLFPNCRNEIVQHTARSRDIPRGNTRSREQVYAASLIRSEWTWRWQLQTPPFHLSRRVGGGRSRAEGDTTGPRTSRTVASGRSPKSLSIRETMARRLSASKAGLATSPGTRRQSLQQGGEAGGTAGERAQPSGRGLRGFVCRVSGFETGRRRYNGQPGVGKSLIPRLCDAGPESM